MDGSNALEELSIRAGIALSQMEVVQELTNDGKEDDGFEKEFNDLSVGVVSTASIHREKYLSVDILILNNSRVVILDCNAGQSHAQIVRSGGGSRKTGTSSGSR